MMMMRSSCYQQLSSLFLLPDLSSDPRPTSLLDCELVAEQQGEDFDFMWMQYYDRQMDEQLQLLCRLLEEDDDDDDSSEDEEEEEEEEEIVAPPIIKRQRTTTTKRVP